MDDDQHFEWATPPPPPPPDVDDDSDYWRKGPWTSHEDKLLTDHVNLRGEGKWNSVSKLTGLRRSGKSCRLRWVNYLRPDLKRGNITPQEELIIQELHAIWGNRWSAIARSLPGRTDNEIKNFWRTHFKKSKPSKCTEKARARFLVRRQQQQRQRQQPKKKKKEGQVLQQQQQQTDDGNQNDDEEDDAEEEEEEEEGEEREMMRRRAEEATALVEEEMAMAEIAYMECVLRGTGAGGSLDGGYASDEGSSGEYVLWGGLWNLDD